MYENVTYESILQRMLDRVPASMDKREGSIIYDAIAPAAVELQLMYIELDVILNEGFADTASLPYLIRRAKERGINQNPATYSVLKAVSTPSSVDIAVGSRFSLNELNYIVTEKITDGEYKVQCETIGVIGNSYFGAMIPINYIADLEHIEITELLIPGEDTEDVESLRERYFKSLDSQAFGGNIADYQEKTLSILGVGGVKVTPIWNGGGTVKLTIIDSTFSVPSDDLIEKVQNTIDPVGHSGDGYGLAPIGHVVTVEGVSVASVNITMDIVYVDGWSWKESASHIKKVIDNYFLELSKEWDSNDSLIIRISQLESRILDCEGVLDVSGTTLNGTAANLLLAKNEIPTRGSINGNQ